jgi:HEAT repeat protein
MLVVFETIAGSGDTLGLYIARTGLGQTEMPRQIEVRHGLDWGVTVGAGESKMWPLGAVPGGRPLSANDVFELVMSAPGAKGFARGGFPVVDARSQYVLKEKIMAPVELKTTRESAVVLPPRILRTPPEPALQPVFVFRQDVARNSFQQVSHEDLPITQAALAPIVLDSTAPPWRRITALNLLAETDYANTQARLVQVAEDSSAPAGLRASAMLNLGVNRHTPSVEVMKRIFAAPGNTRLDLVALEALGEIGDASAASTVRGAIGSADDQLSRIAIRNAARLKDSEAVAPIAAALAATRDEGRMSLCVNALSEIGTAGAWESVIGVVNNSRAPFQARRVGILALGEHAYVPGESALITLLSARDSNNSIQLNVISALEHFKDDAAVAAIVAAAGVRDDTVGRSAVGVLARIKSPRAVEALAWISTEKNLLNSAPNPGC